MRIGIEAQRLFRAKKHGMDVVALESIRAIQQIDSSNEYVIFARPGADISCLQPARNTTVIFVSGVSYADWEQVHLPNAVRKSGVDILHCTSNTAPLNCPVPLVVTIHDIIYLEKTVSGMETASFYQRMGHLYRRWNVPLIARHANQIITVSEYEKQRIREHLPGVSHKLDVVYNGVGEQFCSAPTDSKRTEIRRKYGLPDTYILFLGNTDPKKNTLGTIRAFIEYAASTPEHIPLVIVDYEIEKIQKCLKQGGHPELADSIYQVDYVSPTDMPVLYSLATLFLYPSLRESFGLPILESMAASTPVITSDRTSMPEVAGSAAVLVDPERPEDIAQMIRILTTDVALQSVLIERGIERAANFSWKSTANSLRSIYTSVIGHNLSINDAS